MEAGALGAEIVISGKLTTERARFEKFKAGHFPIVGEPALKAMKTADAHIQLKPGIIGVRVKIMPPDAYFPDKVTIVAPAPEEEKVAAPQPAPAPAPAQVEPEPEVQAKEVVDEPKPESKPEETKE
jgi:small subunit ribosomal protein S3